MSDGSQRRRIPEAFAAVTVAGVRRGYAHRAGLSVAALVTTFVVGVGYLAFDVFDLNPADRQIRVSVHFDDSGGILPGRDVTLRGVPVGEVASVDFTEDGVVVLAEIDARTKIPVGGEVRVAGLSLAGEQYLDFRPTTDGGRYLADGAEITSENTTTPVPLSALLHDMDGMLAQVDPGALQTIVDELGVGPEGPQKLSDIVDGGAFLLSTLDGVLPQTVSLLRTGKIVLGTLADAAPGLQETSKQVSHMLTGVESMDGGFRSFLDTAPGTMRVIDEILAENSPTMVQLLGNLTTVAQMAHVRVPALQEFFFPSERDGSTLEALMTAFRDDGVWALVNIYPRYSCDYDLLRESPTVPSFPEPYLYTYCNDPDPSTLVRGARNAPRPPGEEYAAGLPPGADPLRRSDPTPVGPHTVPLDYGGPALPWTGAN
ncbi:MlaD family protein [Rhodococcus coprophilus]|uniref:Mce family protein n=1 Tax=Rhodococcus coprophilus TaxID=38310 RepID=A0A2X4WZP7_9NOCA|nr:MlaD family protein [Rhodococcus coprophilus]MBM7458443.1 virulence factor Mce-like protein [Rhodococcus coprophilus]SQI32515.1 Mce family protein [Rhodococcus coprophilus]